jgi:hypothetical protein
MGSFLTLTDDFPVDKKHFDQRILTESQVNRRMSKVLLRKRNLIFLAIYSNNFSYFNLNVLGFYPECY